MAVSSTSDLLVGLALGGGCGWWLRARRSRGQQQRQRPAEISDGQWRQWIEAGPQGWLAVTPDQRIASLNARAETLLDVEQGLSLQGQPIDALEPSDEVLHLIELAREKGLPQRGRWPTRSGNLDVRVMPGARGWVGVMVQGRNPLEAQLEQQEQWVSDVAHELRTPLTALSLVGESLADRAEGHQAVLVGRLQKELQRLQVLVSDLLDLSRLDNTPLGESPPPTAINPVDVLSAAWSSLEPLARERGIRLQLHKRAGSNPQVVVDPGRLHQALLNLLDNALRYSPNQQPIEVAIETRDRWCLISVRDHGPGLSAIDQERLFERFYRGDPARARSPRSGSGLGLAIVQQIALSQGGLVRAGNHPDGGALMELLLPRDQPRGK